MNDNPYRSPQYNHKAVYSHELFWRLVKILWVFVLFFIIIDMIILTKGNLYDRCQSPSTIILYRLQEDIKELIENN